MKKKSLLFALLLVLMIACCGCGEKTPVRTTAGMNIRVDETTGSMNITRPKIENPAPMGEKDTWTIFVYLCGADLESRILFGGGMGTDDIKEMCAATASNKVRFVIAGNIIDGSVFHMHFVSVNIVNIYRIDEYRAAGSEHPPIQIMIGNHPAQRAVDRIDPVAGLDD